MILLLNKGGKMSERKVEELAVAVEALSDLLLGGDVWEQGTKIERSADAVLDHLRAMATYVDDNQ